MNLAQNSLRNQVTNSATYIRIICGIGQVEIDTMIRGLYILHTSPIVKLEMERPQLIHIILDYIDIHGYLNYQSSETLRNLKV